MNRVPALHLADSVGYITPPMGGSVVITGSHGGDSAARYALAVRPLLVVFNDAGVGRDGAGVSGLALLQAEGVAAAAVGHDTARIGHARSTLEDGVITHANALARALGAVPGSSCRSVVDQLCSHGPPSSTAP
jgi:hypothetical protein